MTTTNNRWSAALHEAGHGVAAVVLAGRCSGVLLDAAGGTAHIDDLHGDRFAFAIAAGPAAESLADLHDAPGGRVTTPQEVASAPIPADADHDFALACTFADLETVPRSAKSDDRLLAEWSLTGREDDPDSWPGRVRFARHVADAIVRDHADAIVRVASRLFIDGRLTGQQFHDLLNEAPNA